MALDSALSEENEGDSTREASTLTSSDKRSASTVSAKKLYLPPEKFKQPFKPPAGIDVKKLPETYTSNSDREKLINSFAYNFRRQYVYLYRERKPLFLCPLNEAGVEKFVVLTVRLSLLPFRELWNYDGASSFVADYLAFEPLENPIELPKCLYSPTTILKLQRGNCFDFSVLLCSFLLGAGYDAYVVCGYATKETCFMDESREVCPLLTKTEEVTKKEVIESEKKYSVKPPKDLTSKYERFMEEKRRKEEADRAEKARLEELARIAELDKPPPDDLHGLRIHSWVLVLEGKREVPENFFIEALTGQTFSVGHPAYLGIESLWNHQNYWVNMQDCSNGCKDLSFDLGDCTKWEYMFPHVNKPTLQIPDQDVDQLYGDEDEDQQLDNRMVELPPSWVDEIVLSDLDFETRCPEGKKTVLYKKARLEKFAVYSLRDGLVKRLSVYEEYEMLRLLNVREWFENRQDKLYERYHDKVSGRIHDYFIAGRPGSMKEHVYLASSTYSAETDRTMIFYVDARVDGLLERVEGPLIMTEKFQNRDDLLTFREVIYQKRIKVFGPSDTKNHRPIATITEKYDRNPEKPANEDIAERIYNIREEKISITYHRDDNKIASSFREFMKPSSSDEKVSSATPVLTPDMVTSFEVDQSRPPLKHLVVYQMFLNLLNDEASTIQSIRNSEDEISSFLTVRKEEETKPRLDRSHYDTKRNDDIKRERQLREKQELEEKMRQEDFEIDYLAPFLSKIGNPQKINKDDAYKLKNDCLADLKQRLIDKANLIQARYEKETHELQERQKWYQTNQVSLQKEDEEKYLNDCSAAMFRLHILEQRINRHKAQAPGLYNELEEKLNNDPRLADYLRFK